MNSKESGYGLLEFVVSTAISTPLILLLVQYIVSQHSFFIEAKQQKEQTSAAVTLYRAVERVSTDLDSHPLRLYPRAHSGRITYTDGTNVHHKRISTSTTGFTTTSLRFYELLTLTENNQGTHTACMTYSKKATLLSGTPIRSVLLLSGNGFFEAHAILTGGSQPGCYTILLRSPSRSMITTIPSEESIRFARFAIPIRWIQTYFRDTESNLRIFRHAGETVYLNQAISKNTPAFDFVVSDSAIPGRLNFRLTIKDKKDLIFSHRIPRTDFRHLLWSIG